MFDTVSYTYDKNKKTYTFHGWWGTRFRAKLDSVGYRMNKQKYLFIKLTSNSMVIHRFFLLDLKQAINEILSTDNTYGVNIRTLANLQDTIKNTIYSQNSNKPYIDMDVIAREFNLSPLKIQEPIYARYGQAHSIPGNKGMLLDAAVGSGKTYMSLSLAEALHSEVTLIIVTLPTIRTVWISSISGDDSLFKHPKKHYRVGSSGEYSGEKYVIVHYENMPLILDLYKKFNINFTTLIVDEIHNFTEIRSARTKSLLKITSTIPFTNTIPMSGTPIRAKAKELLPLFKIINFDLSDRSIENRFIKLYTRPTRIISNVQKERYLSYAAVIKKSDITLPELTTTTFRVKLKNSKHYTLDSIVERMKHYMLVRTEELDKAYPRHAAIYYKHYNNVKSMLLGDNIVTAKDIRAYEDNIKIILSSYENNALQTVPESIKDANTFEKTYIEKYLSTDDKWEFKDSKTVFKYLRLKVMGEVLSKVVMQARIDCYSELASKINLLEFINATTKKTIIFSNYINVCSAATASAISYKLRPITVYGPTTKNLTKNVNMFTHDEKINPLIATYKALSTGVPITVANIIVILGVPYRQYELEQAIGRAWRVGQDIPVTVYIIELDTGSTANITNRDLDIISFYRDEVTALTGRTDSVMIDNKYKELISELGVFEVPLSGIPYLNRLLKKSKEVLGKWI